jgi:hypothetical protein
MVRLRFSVMFRIRVRIRVRAMVRFMYKVWVMFKSRSRAVLGLRLGLQLGVC